VTSHLERAGAETFGITWKTVETNDVVIELTKERDGASRLTELTPSDYGEVRTRKQLAEKVSGGDDTSVLYFAAVHGKAAGSVFGVINREVPYLLKVTGSHTSISRLGTTVTLVGEYKR